MFGDKGDDLITKGQCMTAETVTDNSIPADLRNRAQWKPRIGKDPGHGWNMAENLRTYDQACDHARKIGADGVIYIVLEDDPYTFVDLDGVRDSETGTIETWAQEIIDRLDSYTEISSSGTRCSYPYKASKPGDRTQTHAAPGLEMYHVSDRP
jgi:primase-polymerase (primpol)-like protein